MSKLISIVIPLYNEEETLPLLYSHLSSINLSRYRKEVILVIDPGTDRTFEIARDICRKDKSWKAILLSKRYGQDYAINVGLMNAKGTAAVVMDGDLQDPPELIPEMVAVWEKGDSIVSAVRKHRGGEGAVKRATSYLFNRILKHLLKGDITVDAGNFKLIDRSIVDAYTSIRGADKYFRAVDALTQFKSRITFDQPPRVSGKTKYNFLNSLSLALNAAISSTAAILRFAILLSAVFTIISLVYGLFILYSHFTGAPVEGWASTNFFIAVFASMQFFMIGALGEYVYRNNLLLRNNDAPIIKETLNLSPLSRHCNK